MKYNKENILKLNLAYQKIRDGLCVLKINVHKNDDINTHIYRIEKSIESINKTVLMKMKRDNMDDEFNNIIKDFT